MDGRAALDYGPNRPVRHAIEVRNHSFADPAFVGILRRHNVAVVVGDTSGKWPMIEDVTADFVYLRLHGLEQDYPDGYTPEALERWAQRVRAWQAGGEPADARRVVAGASVPARPRDVYCYFDNDQKALAPRDAQSLARILGVSPTP
jgi:uncharacterized protein YecE (DUF72 family)